MSLSGRMEILGPRTFAILSVVGVVGGLPLIALMDPLLSTIGTVAIILGVVCLLFAVGLYLSDPEPVETEQANPD